METITKIEELVIDQAKIQEMKFNAMIIKNLSNKQLNEIADLVGDEMELRLKTTTIPTK